MGPDASQTKPHHLRMHLGHAAQFYERLLNSAKYIQARNRNNLCSYKHHCTSPALGQQSLQAHRLPALQNKVAIPPAIVGLDRLQSDCVLRDGIATVPLLMFRSE